MVKRWSNTAGRLSPRQVLAIGVTNILCGLLGGFPATATLSMTPLNVKSGAKSRCSLSHTQNKLHARTRAHTHTYAHPRAHTTRHCVDPPPRVNQV
jgi:hypothetical protein